MQPAVATAWCTVTLSASSRSPKRLMSRLAGAPSGSLQASTARAGCGEAGAAGLERRMETSGSQPWMAGQRWVRLWEAGIKLQGHDATSCETCDGGLQSQLR